MTATERELNLTIRTPEGIEFSLPLAGPFSRMLALAVDLAVIAAAGRLLEQLAAPLVVLGVDFAGAITIVAYYAMSLIYAALAEWLWRGQTIGKRLFGLRVVDASGLRLEPAQVIVRNLMRFVDLLPAAYLVGGIACVLSRRRQRLGDMAAGTVVIRTARPGRPDLSQVLGGKYNTLAESRHLAARLRQKTSPEAARIALETLLRRDRLSADARAEVFRELAEYFREVATYPPEMTEQLPNEAYVRDAVEILYGSEKRGTARS